MPRGNCAANKIFIMSAILIVIFLIMTFFPQLLTFGKNPNTCDLTLSRQAPSSEAWFGYDNNGCDVYTRTIYGAKASIMVGVFATAVHACCSEGSSALWPVTSAA